MSRRPSASGPVAPGGMVAIETILRDGIGLDPDTIGSSAIERAARIRMAALGVSDPIVYAARLQADHGERQRLVEDVVVGESWFFRDGQVFAFVTDLAVTRTGLPGRGPLRILSAPCAGGEEPYSVAMALRDAGLAADQFTIDAVDVSHVALERAAVGRYSANAFRNADCSFRDRWFRTDGTASLIDPTVRAGVRFSAGNLVDESFATGRDRYDVIFCRNLLIYLTPAARRRVEATLDGLLAADGVLILGAAEPPILEGDWIPAGAASVFALRRGVRPATAVVAGPPGPPRRPTPQPAPLPRDTVPPATDAAPPVLADVLATAGALANAGRYPEALDRCAEARGRLPPSPQLFFLEGMIHQAAGDLDRAEGCLHKTLYLDAGHDEALLALALLATRRGDLRMAETYRQSAARVLGRKGAT